MAESDDCYYKDDDTTIDPDTDLGYIDEKLQNVLGHFQKDFEGGVSAENLGAIYGGYGSFLPMHQRSPSVRSDPKTPQRSQNHNRPRSPSNLHLEGVPKNSLVPSVVPPSLKHGTTSLGMHFHDPKFAPLDGLAKPDPSLLHAQAASTVPAKSESSTKPGSQTDPKRLKLRIKVRSDCSAQKNAAIYSGIGLTSPSSPIEHSLKDVDREPSKSHMAPVESPSSILEYMTSFPVTVAMLSPLHASLLHLKGKKNIPDDSKSYMPIKVYQNDSAVLMADSTSNVSKKRKTNLVGGIGTVEEDRHGVGVNYVNMMISPAQEHSEIPTLDEKQYLSSDLELKILSSPACNTSDVSKRIVRTNQANWKADKGVPLKKRYMHDWVKDRSIFTGVVNEESAKLKHGRDGAKCDQQAPKSSLMERIRGQGIKSSEKDISADLRGLGRAKGDRVHSLSKEQPDVFKRKKDINNELKDHPKQKVGSSCTQYKQGRLGLNEVSKKIPLEDKTKSKGRQSKIRLTSHLIDERLRSDDILESKQRARKNVAKLPSSSEDIHDMRLGHRANKMDQLERPFLDCIPKDQNIKMIKESYETNDIAYSEGHASKWIEDWVQCDSCQTWRLLPYGTNAEQLPETWYCSMLNWLPGMNSCVFSQDETSNALRALYQPALPPHESNNIQSQVDQITTRVASGDVPSFNQNLGIDTMLNREKKRHKVKENPAAVSSSGVIQTSSLTKNSQQENMKKRFLNDMNKPFLKANLISDSTTQHTDILSDYSLERYACKQKEKQIDEGATNPKRLKLKREPDRSGYKTSKRVITEAAIYSDEYRNLKSSGNLVRMSLGSSSDFPTSATGKNVQKHIEHLYSKDGKSELKDRLQSAKTLRDTSPGITNFRLEGMEKYNERHGKKRTLKDRQDGQKNLETFQSQDLPDGGYMKEMQSRVAMTEGHESSACRVDDKLSKKGKVTRIILSGSRDSLSARHDQQQRKLRKSNACQLTLYDIVSLKKDLGSEQFSTAATSSSSKVSDSRKRSSYQEVRGSPVESVSSSPVRHSSLEKVSLVRRGSLGNDYANTCEFSAGGTINSLEHRSKLDRNQIGVFCRGKASGVLQAESVRCPMLECQDHDVSGEADSSVKPLYDCKSKHLLANDEVTLTQHQQCLTDVHSMDHCQSVQRMNTIHGGASGLFLQKPGKDSSLLSEDRDKSSYNAQKVNVKLSNLLSDQGLKPNNDKNTAIKRSKYSQGDIEVKISGHDSSNAKSGDLSNLDGRGVHEQNSGGEIAMPSNSTRVELRYEKTQAHPHHTGKKKTPTHVCQPVSPSLKGSGLDISSFSGCRDLSKVLQHSGNSVHQNGVHHSAGNPVAVQSMYQNIDVPKPVKGYICSQAATDVLREAENLRGHADHLKNSGFKFDSIMANFQAALKSLFGAFLLENSTSSSGRSECGETPQLQIYSSSAKLFETCAQDFEKHEEMYAAALAYKCTEVAYFRAVYCKNSSATGDRVDLQASLQMVPQGESPSSSASDIDSLYNQVPVDKTALSRGTTFNPTNHVTVVRNRPTIGRLLQFTHAMSLVMEASRKSQIAFEAANEILKNANNNGGGIAVKRVLDHSYHDVEEFIRLVRLANEAICSSHI